MNYNCSIFWDLRNLQEQVKKAFCYQKLFWPFTVWINCSYDLKIFENSQPSASNFKSFSRSLKQFFLTVGQNNFGNKKNIFHCKKKFTKNYFLGCSQSAKSANHSPESCSSENISKDNDEFWHHNSVDGAAVNVIVPSSVGKIFVLFRIYRFDFTNFRIFVYIMNFSKRQTWHPFIYCYSYFLTL